MRGRLDPFSRDTLDLFGVRKDSSQLAREEILVLGAQFEAREAGDTFNVAA
jgi:hypothetical protein